jgi:hypothetical protein
MYEPNSGCWLWTGGLDTHGYAQLGKPGKNNGNYLAHRLSWELHRGEPIPDGLLVCHKCDVPSCVNPHHMFLGSNQDNTNDKLAKGRQPSKFGEKNPKAKLTEAMVEEIRSSPLPRLELAAKFGVTRTHIGYIQRGDCWAA